ncbi:MAG: twin-arginine translocation signal domain-containing protein [Haloarculaceae archaeon]
MTNDDSGRVWGINRRDVLKSAAAVGAIGGVGLPAMSGSVAAAAEAQQYAVLQGGDQKGCVTAISADMPVEEYYDYSNYHSNNDELNSRNASGEGGPKSVLFLYEDTREEGEGTSLVVMHGSTEDDVGGAVDFTSMDLPSGGSWVVKDDDTSAEFSSSQDTAPQWRWKPNQTDGGAWNGGLECDFEVSITAEFDFDEVSRKPASGVSNQEIETWYVLSGDDSTVDLNLNEPVTIKCDCCTECTTDTDLLAKYEWDEDASKFVLEGDGDTNISFDSWTTDEGGEPIQACFTTDYCHLDAVVKAGTEYETTDVGVQASGTCVTGIVTENPQGKRVAHAISNVRFYCTAPDDVSVGNSGNSNRPTEGTDPAADGDHDNGHGNDADGYDESNPGKSDGVAATSNRGHGRVHGRDE